MNEEKPKSCKECKYNTDDSVWCTKIEDWRYAYVKVKDGEIRKGCPFDTNKVT